MATAVQTRSTPQIARLAALEATIERGLQTFVEVGTALMEIRTARLYANEYSTFEDYCLKRWGFVASRARQLIASAEVVANLESVTTGNAPASERAVRPLMSLEPKQQREAWERALEISPTPTAAVVEQAVREVQGKPHVANNSGNNEWYTPAPLIAAAREVMGSIDVDPASSDLANLSIGATVYYTVDQDGRNQEWRGNVWMNPPYAQPLIADFCEAIVQKYGMGEVTQACVLVNNATETTWFQHMLHSASAVCFPKSRVRFIDTEGKPSGAPLQGQAVLYFGTNGAQFADVFSQFGAVLRGC